MPPIDGLEIENFRCFEKLRVQGLTRVNLLVGKNNSGKTALLEAIEALVSTDDTMLLYRASVARGETRLQRRQGREDGLMVDVRHWFYGHRLEVGGAFHLRASGTPPLFVTRTIEQASASAPERWHIKTMVSSEGRKLVSTSPLTPDGFIGSGTIYEFEGGFEFNSKPSVRFVTTRPLRPVALAALWEDVALTPRETATVEALRLIEPAIERIAVLGTGDASAAQVLLRGASKPIPLGSLGEGASRILALALQLVGSQGGFLLVDELENGLHWSVMQKVWRFLIESARRLDVQIFATTHSKDCLDALAALHGTDPQLTAEVSVHRLERGRETPVRFDAARIAECVEMELETR